MKKKWKLLIVVVIALVCMCTGCNSTVKEKDIKEDLENYTKESILGDEQKIDKVEIEKRNTNKQQKTDEVWCTVTITDSNIEYQKHYVLTYLLYDQGGWNLDEVTSDDSQKDTVKPLKGVNKNDIKESLLNYCINVNGEEWEIESGEIKEIEIKNQKTNLKKKTDNLMVKITLESRAEIATGEIKLKYKFTNQWNRESLEEQGKFKLSDKKEKKLDISEEKLLSAIEKDEITYKVKKEENTQNDNDMVTIDTDNSIDFSVTKDEISNLKIESEQRKYKGEKRIYKCSFDVKKNVMSCNIKAEILYELNEKKWEVTRIDTEIPADSVTFDLVGEWKGTFKGVGGNVGNAELNITNMDGNNITATYSYTPEVEMNYVNSGSYNVSGTFDVESRGLNLTAGDWIDKPEKPGAFEKSDIVAEVDFTKGTITGKGHNGIVFTVEK